MEVNATDLKFLEIVFDEALSFLEGEDSKNCRDCGELLVPAPAEHDEDCLYQSLTAALARINTVFDMNAGVDFLVVEYDEPFSHPPDGPGGIRHLYKVVDIRSGRPKVLADRIPTYHNAKIVYSALLAEYGEA